MTANPAVVTGRGLWLQVTNVIILTENMRQRDDPRYFELLQRLRINQCTEDDWALLCTRSINPAACDKDGRDGLLPSQVESSIGFQYAPLIVGRNSIRASLNIAYAHALAKRHQLPLIWATAVDRFGDQTDLATKRRLTKILRTLPESQTKYTMQRLPLVIGMRVLLRKNLCTEWNLCNGSEGTIRHVVYASDDDKRLVEAGKPGQSVRLRELPEYVLVEFPRASADCIFT